MNIIQFIGALEIGLFFGLVAIGVYLTFRIVDFPDLTVDGSFPLGAAIASAMIVGGYDPVISTLVAILGGVGAGMVTAYLNVKWGIFGLLAGILTMTGLYSINFRIMGKPNVALLDERTLFSMGSSVFWVLVPVVGVVLVLLILFFKTQIGLAVRACGQNHKVARAQGVKVNKMIFLTLALSNGVVALAGALFAQSQGFADINLGQGTIITGLASVIIAEAIFPTRSVSILLFACIVGSVVYRIVLAFALNAGDVGLVPTDLKLITAVLVAVTMIIPKIRKKAI